MQNPFIIIRFISFSLMIFVNMLTIVFASWNVAVTVAEGISAPGASVFLILNGCAIFLFITAGLIELVISNARTANVAFECGWTVVFSILQLGAAVAATVNGPPSMCQPGATWGICASSHLLVPVSWLSSFTVLAYFLMLFGTIMAHIRTYPSVWWSSVYSVPWFVTPTPTLPFTASQPKSRPPSHSKTPSASSKTARDSFIVLRYLNDRFLSGVEDPESQISEPILFPTKSNGLQKDLTRRSTLNRPAWARKTTARRGLDAPFRKADNMDDGASIETKVENPGHKEVAAPQPVIAQARRGIDPPFARKMDIPNVPPAAHFANTQTLQVPHFDTHPISPVQRKLTVSPVFSNRIKDQDVPIPLPKLSEWVRADSPPSTSPQRT